MGQLESAGTQGLVETARGAQIHAPCEAGPGLEATTVKEGSGACILPTSWVIQKPEAVVSTSLSLGWG